MVKPTSTRFDVAPGKPLIGWIHGLIALAFLALWMAPAAAAAWPAAFDCQWRFPQLDCDFRPLAPVQVATVELALNIGEKHAAIPWQPFGESGATSAILWLVDVSDPARQATVEAQRRVLERWSQQLEDPHHRLGLAAFAGSFKTLVPMGSDSSVLAQGLEKLAASGHSTAFYQSLLTGLELLRWTPAERKSLWVFSDGMAEDTAYRHEDVVAAARAAGVMIVGLGYPERKSQRPQLQRLQRLAEETGGYFMAAQNQALPAHALADILAVIDGGGKVSLPLPELIGTHQATLTLYDSMGAASTTPLTLDGPTPSRPIVTVDVDAQPVSMGQSPVAEQSQEPYWRRWVLIGSGVVGVIVLLWWGQRRRLRLVSAQRPMLARFERLDSGAKLPIYSALCHLGRASDNDLCFSNDSVSSHHAELQQRRDTTFTICDLGSTNGVWVNGERVTSRRLDNGDLVELGEIRLRFWKVA